MIKDWRDTSGDGISTTFDMSERRITHQKDQIGSRTHLGGQKYARSKLDDPSSDITDHSSKTTNPSLMNELHNRSPARKGKKDNGIIQYHRLEVLLYIIALLFVHFNTS